MGDASGHASGTSRIRARSTRSSPTSTTRSLSASSSRASPGHRPRCRSRPGRAFWSSVSGPASRSACTRATATSSASTWPTTCSSRRPRRWKQRLDAHHPAADGRARPQVPREQLRLRDGVPRHHRRPRRQPHDGRGAACCRRGHDRDHQSFPQRATAGRHPGRACRSADAPTRLDHDAQARRRPATVPADVVQKYKTSPHSPFTVVVARNEKEIAAVGCAARAAGFCSYPVGARFP